MAEKIARARHLRVFKDMGRRALFHQCAALENHHAMGHAPGERCAKITEPLADVPIRQDRSAVLVARHDARLTEPRSA
jgi:hypothetical protein